MLRPSEVSISKPHITALAGTGKTYLHRGVAVLDSLLYTCVNVTRAVTLDVLIPEQMIMLANAHRRL